MTPDIDAPKENLEGCPLPNGVRVTVRSSWAKCRPPTRHSVRRIASSPSTLRCRPTPLPPPVLIALCAANSGQHAVFALPPHRCLHSKPCLCIPVPSAHNDKKERGVINGRTRCKIRVKAKCTLMNTTVIVIYPWRTFYCVSIVLLHYRSMFSIHHFYIVD